MLDQTAKLTLADVEALKAKGYSQTDIAEMFGVTRQYVSWIVKNYGGKQTPRQKVGETFPFKAVVPHTQSTQYKNLRDHGEYMATGGKGMDPRRLRRLRGWYSKLRNENLVVEYDPSNPPEPGVNIQGGFTYRQRTPEDGDLLVRRNDHCHLTEEGSMIWRFPAVEP